MSIYERDKWIGLPEGVMRPGGMALTEELVRLSGLKKNARILDIGCGLGSTVAYLRGMAYAAEGIDIAASLIARGLELYPGAPLYTADAVSLPLDCGRIDAVLIECSLSEMRAEQVLEECRRVLTRSGMLLVSDLYAICGSARNGEELMTLAGWRSLLSEHGFDHVFMEDRSQALSDFIAQILWQRLDILSECGKWYKAAPARLGYFIAVARKA